MTLRRSLLAIVGIGLVLGIIGALIGAAIGLLIPDFYRTVFRIAPGEGINLVSLGTGLGLTQGISFGIGVGLVVVIVCAWREVRLAQCGSKTPSVKS